MKRIATTLAVAAVAVAVSAGTAAAKPWDPDGDLVTIGTAVSSTGHATVTAADLFPASSEEGNIDVAIATAMAAHGQYVPTVKPSVTPAKAKAKHAKKLKKLHKKDSRPAKVVYLGRH